MQNTYNLKIINMLKINKLINKVDIEFDNLIYSLYYIAFDNPKTIKKISKLKRYAKKHSKEECNIGLINTKNNKYNSFVAKINNKIIFGNILDYNSDNLKIKIAEMN